MRTSLVIAAALGAAIPTVSFAEEPLKVVIEVPYGDLDLTQPADEKTFKKRMARMIKDACIMESPLSMQRAKTDWQCVETAKRDGISQLAYHKSRGPALASR